MPGGSDTLSPQDARAALEYQALALQLANQYEADAATEQVAKAAAQQRKGTRR